MMVPNTVRILTFFMVSQNFKPYTEWQVINSTRYHKKNKNNNNIQHQMIHLIPLRNEIVLNNNKNEKNIYIINPASAVSQFIAYRYYL